MAEETKEPEQASQNVGTGIKQVLAEDEDKTVDLSEIERIFRIYLGRPATEEENARFDGIRESEFKILEKYIKREQDKIESEEEAIRASDAADLDMAVKQKKNNLDAMEKQGKNEMNMAVKQNKLIGDKNLEVMKNIGIGGQIQSMPANVTIPPTSSGLIMSGGDPSMGTSASTERKQYLQDGENFLVQFKD